MLATLETTTTDRADCRAQDDLWADAYKLLRERDKNIVHEYEKTLGSTLDSVGESLSNPVSVRKLVERLREVHYGKQLIFRFRGEEHKYRDQFNNLVKLAIFADALVKQALATQPYAALAWTGVSILLPLLSSALAGEAALVKGLAAVGHVQLYWKSCEDTYLKPSIANNYDIILRQLPTVYSHILEYYFHAICYLAKDKKRRMLQVTTGWTSWSDKAGDIDKESDFCKTLLQPAQQTTLERVNEAKLQRLDSLFKATRDIAKVMSENRAEDIEMQICENLKRVAGNYETAKNSNLERVKGTCEWFFSDPDFCNWRDSMENGLFWVSADPGCGKSVLSRALIDDGHLKSTVSTFDMTSSVATVREEDNSVCYFFFKEDVQGRTMLVNAFSAILHELFAQDKTNQLIQHAAAHHRLNAKFLAEEFIPLWDILVACSSSISGGGVICVLDALDECEREDRDLLMEKLQDYYTASQGEQKLKFLITSRPYKTITRLFNRFSRRAKLLHLDGDDKHDEVSRDMDLVIDARLDDITEYFSQKDREKVRERLRSQGSKTYLWLHLAFSIIKDSPSKYSRSQDVETLLSSIPPEVSQAYEKILDRSEDEEKTIILLQLVLAAQTPLTLAEANYALTLAGAPTKPQRHDDLTARCYGADFRSTVKSFCGLIITIQDGCLHFIHLTAREFLMSDKPEAGSKWKGRFALGPGLHEEMSRCCISYLLLDDWIEIAPVAAASQDPNQENRFPLLNYASRNWGHHFGQLSEVMRTPIKKDARRLLDADGPYVKLWGARFRPYPSNPELNWGKHVFDGWTDLAIASLLGLRDMVEEMLVDEKVDFNTSHKNWSALSAAIHGGHESTAALLLSHGATVSHGANIRDLVRYAADVANDSAVLSFLLERFGKKISITSTVVMAAARSIKRTDAWYETTLAELLGKRNDEVVLTSELLRATSLYMEPIGWLEMFSKWKHEEIRRQAPLALLLAVETGTELAGLKLLADGELITPAMVTEEVFTAMVKNTSSGIDMLKYILAKYKHEVSIPQTLLEKLVGYNYGLKVDVLDYLMNQRPDDFRVTRDAMDAAARNGRGNFLEYLYTHSSHDGDVSGLETQWAVMAQLRSAARRGNLEDTKAAVERGANVNSRSMDGKTALHEAAYQGHADVVEFLLARPDVEVNTFDSYGRTPLHEAAQQGREKILKFLLARPDVDVNTFDIYGRTPLHDCRGYQNGKIARMLLLEAAADPNPADEEGRTPLHTAIYQDHLYLLRILIEAGADVDRADNRGITPRMLAEEWAEWNYWRHWKMIEGWEMLRSSRIYEGSI
ncbi:hypothetical protein ACQRIU_005372 [Beauveria bassiana]